MGRELKSSVSIAASLLLGFLLLFSQSTTNTVSAGTGQPGLSPTASSEQQVIARFAVKNQEELELLIAVGVNILDRRTGEEVYVLTTVAKLEELIAQGWSATILYVRDLEGNSLWQSVEPPFGGECAFSINPTERSFTAGAAVSTFTLTTGSLCEWVVFTDSPWLQINGVGQGTGSAIISFSVAANPTTSNRIGHIFVGGQVFTVFQGVQFNDVPVGHPFYLEIGKISARGITLGCGNNNFCPDGIVAREQMAAFIVRALGEFNPPTPASQRYTDVPPSNQFYNFIDRLAELGITQGCTATTFCPSEPVRREQAAAFLLRALGEFNPPTPASQRFVDVPPSNPFYNFIDRLAVLGITQGCSSSPPMFCPTAPMTRAQMAAFLVRAFNL